MALRGRLLRATGLFTEREIEQHVWDMRLADEGLFTEPAPLPVIEVIDEDPENGVTLVRVRR